MKNHRALVNYREAREIIMQKLHLKKDVSGFYVSDVYCNLRARRSVGPHKMPSHTVINIEHTWPQSRFSKKFSKRIQKADLHHLYPTNSVANSTRGNHTFGEARYGDIGSNCHGSKLGAVKTDNGDVIVFDPPKSHKGNVARALFYFSVRYDIDIPAHEERFLRQWNRLDPVDNEERIRNNKIAKIQGNRNPFVDFPSKADLVSDF